MSCQVLSPNGYLMRLSSEIWRVKFHFVDMIRDRTWADLEETLAFQKIYAKTVCRALEIRFGDNDIIFAFSVLNCSNIPWKRVGLNLWGVTELELFLKQYDVQKKLEDKIIFRLIDSDACRRGLFNLKLQANLNWNNKTFKDLWAMVTWNEPLQLKYANILLLVEIAWCHCVSTTTCERAISIQNVIKTKQINRLGTKHLDVVLRVALEGPQDGYDYILVEAMNLWRNNAKWRYLYLQSKKYIGGHSSQIGGIIIYMFFDVAFHIFSWKLYFAIYFWTF